MEGNSNPQGCSREPEVHHTNIFRIFKRWVKDGCFEKIFIGSVSNLFKAGLLDTSIIHGDGTTTAAKKGGDNIGVMSQGK